MYTHRCMHLSPCVTAAKTCNLSPTAWNASSAPLSLFSLPCVIHTCIDQRVLWGVPEQISSATVCQTLQAFYKLTTITSPAQALCPGSCDRHVSLFPGRDRLGRSTWKDLRAGFTWDLWQAWWQIDIRERGGLWCRMNSGLRAALAFGLLPLPNFPSVQWLLSLIHHFIY